MNGVLIAIAADVAAVALLALFAVHAVRRAHRASAGVKTITGSFEDRLATVNPDSAVMATGTMDR